MFHHLAHITLVRPALLLALCLGATHARAAEPTSQYTTIEESACRKVVSPDPGVERECPAPKGWRLLLAGSEERSWLVLGHGKTLWSTWDVMGDPRLGNFVNLKGKQVEWRLAAGHPATVQALIFRVSGQNPDNTDKQLNNLIVIGLKEDTPRLCGVVKTNEEARALADSLSDCTTPLGKTPG